MEQVLSVVLDSVGGSIEALEKALDEIAHTPAKGPRDASIKEIISKLLSFDRFKSYHIYYNNNNNNNNSIYYFIFS